jgi:type IV secretory pathway TraG/TraD family ATPase VirD4
MSATQNPLPTWASPKRLQITADEVTQICPVPLPLWMADSAGKGILIVAVCHGLAQLEARWDKAGARAIWDTAGIKVILGGVSDPDTLDRLSRLCGEIALRTHSRTRTEDGRRARTCHYQHVRVLPPELLRTLPQMAGADPAHQPVPRHRPAPDGLATTRLPPRPPDQPSTTTSDIHR